MSDKKILAGHQPEYLPYIGYFYKMMCADIFVLVDHVQYGKKQFQNRNKIRNANGSDGWAWLTIPVITHARYDQKICDVKICNETNWREKHFKSIYYAYKGTPFFEQYITVFQDIYSKSWENLADLNEALILAIIGLLNLKIKVVKSSSYDISGERTDMLIDLCRKIGANGYLSGEGGRNYVDESKFKEAELSHQFSEFKHPIYQQKFKPFLPYMSIIDLLFNHGQKSMEIILAENKEGALQNGKKQILA